MLLEEYVSKAEEVAELTESGNHEGALQILKGLLEADLPDLDKAVMWVNAATVYDKMDRFEEAIRCYDEAIALEGVTIGAFPWNGRPIFWLTRAAEKRA